MGQIIIIIFRKFKMGNWAFYVICPVEASSHCVTPLHCINGQLPEITPYSLGGGLVPVMSTVLSDIQQ